MGASLLALAKSIYYRQQKTLSCTMELKSNFSLNQAWPQCPR